MSTDNLGNILNKLYFTLRGKGSETMRRFQNGVNCKELPGFKFSTESPTAKRLNESRELHDEIFNSKNYDFKTGEFKSDKLMIEFKNDENLNYSFGHMTILNPKIKDGYVVGTAFDLYDFDAMYGEKFEDVSQRTKDLNNRAYTLQTLGQLKNYYIFVPIKVKIR